MYLVSQILKVLFKKFGSVISFTYLYIMTKEELKIVKKIVAEGYKLKAQLSNPDWKEALENAENFLLIIN